MSKHYHWHPKKGRKPRSVKADGVHMGMDMCPHCIAFNCDPLSMSPKFRNKIGKRLENNLCPSCGKNPCKCKSSDSLPERPLSANSMLRAQAIHQAKMEARRAQFNKIKEERK